MSTTKEKTTALKAIKQDEPAIGSQRPPILVAAGLPARQGDWILAPCERPDSFNRGSVVLDQSSSVRNSHEFVGLFSRLTDGSIVISDGMLTHNEHRHLRLSPDGWWRCMRQRVLTMAGEIVEVDD